MNNDPFSSVAKGLVDGVHIDSASEQAVDVINPSTGAVVTRIPTGDARDVDLAVRSCRAAFEDGRWSDLPPSSRKRILQRFADLIARDRILLDRHDAEDMGKPIRLALANADGAAALMRYHAEAVDKVTGFVYTSDARSLALQRRVPRGVVAAVVPWNFPTYNSVIKIAPALAAGNCVVLKPSELSPRSALHLAELALESGIPAGVLNLVLGLGETAGQALGLHPDVDMITFTGSTAVGKAMLEYSGRSNMKYVMTECGGKSPQIVFADATDLHAIGNAIAAFFLINQGQLCSVGSRLLVHRSIEKPLLQAITARLRQIVVGNASDTNTTFGPIATYRQCERVIRYVSDAPTEGAELVMGGRRILQETGGFFVEPTVFRNVAPRSRIAQEEIFGPVLSVIPFADEAEAIRIANGTIYGLSAYVWTSDLSRGLRVAKAIRSSITINAVPPTGEGAGHALCSEPARQSGIAVEGGLGGLESYLRRQYVAFNHG